MRMFLILTLLLFACAPPDDPVPTSDALSGQSVVAGAQLFVHETFQGNSRTCATCHAPTNFFALDPAEVARQYAQNPNGPLFQAIDSNDGHGSDFSLLLADANARIPIVCAPNVTIDELGTDPDVSRLPDGRYVTILRRSTPTVNNIFFEDHLMWDGREAADLPGQAIAAVNTHFQPGRQPTQTEAGDIADFQSVLYSRPRLALFAAGGPPPQLPQGITDLQRQGRAFFVDGPRGLCAMCHGGPLLNTVNSFNPLGIAGERIATNFSSELGTHNTPVRTYRVTMPDNSVRVLQSSDPGRTLITGNPCEDPFVCFVNPGSFASVFKIPTLWGVSQTAPYFHDNSRADLDALLEHYQAFFHITALGLASLGFPNASDFEISDGDAAAIKAFLLLL